MQNPDVEQNYQVVSGGISPETDRQVNAFLHNGLAMGGIAGGIALAVSNGPEALAAGSGEDAKTSDAPSGTDGENSLPGGNGSPSADSIDENSTPDGTDGQSSANSNNGSNAPAVTEQYGLLSPEEYEELLKNYTITPGDRLSNITPVDEPNGRPNQQTAGTATSTEAKNPLPSTTTAKPSNNNTAKNKLATNRGAKEQPVTPEVTATTTDDMPPQSTIDSIPHFTVKPGVELVESKPATGAQANVKSDESLDPGNTILLATGIIVGTGLAVCGRGIFRERQPGKHSIRK